MSAEQGGDAKVPEQGEVERLRREAQDAACIYHGRICYGEGDLHAAIDALADLAKRYREERDKQITDRERVVEGLRNTIEQMVKERDEARRLHDEHCSVKNIPKYPDCTPPWKESR